MANSRQYLRRTNLRWVGLIILAMGIIAFIMIEADKPLILRYGLPAIFVIWGVSWLAQKSQHSLWIDGDRLHWESTQGKDTTSDNVLIRDIQKIELLKKGKVGRNSMQWVEVVITARGKNVTLPRKINFGGTGNPKFDDIVKTLREYNAGFSYEMKDLMDRSALLGHQDDS